MSKQIPSGTATMIDIARSFTYAAANIERLKCQDKNILDFACNGENKNCLTWKINGSKLAWVPVNGIDATSTCSNDDDCNAVYPFCLDGMCGIKSDPYSDNIKMAMGPGQCEVVDRDTCLSASTYPYEKYNANKQEYESTTRAYEDGDYADKKERHGRCKPQNCDPENDKNCSQTVCIPASCRDENDCGGKGTTGTCNPVTKYCDIDIDNKCSTDDDCGNGTSGCDGSGQYILTDDQKTCWSDNGEKDPDTGESKYPGKECDPEVTTGFCYETGTCPEPYVGKNNNIVYLEWHKDAGTCDLEGKTSFCEHGKNSSCVKFEDEGRCSCIKNDDCAGNSTCTVDGDDGMKLCSIYDVNNNADIGRCVYGNHLLRQYAENPQCRGGAESNSNTAAFNHFNPLPPFAYDKGSGKAFLTDQYCWYGNMKWGQSKGSPEDTKVLSGMSCEKVDSNDLKKYPNGSVNVTDSHINDPCKLIAEDWYCAKEYSNFKTETGKWKCTGPGSQCNLPSGWQEFWQLTLGKTLYNGFFGTGWGKCHLPDSFEDVVTPAGEGFQKQKVNNDPLQNIPDIQKLREIASGFTKIKDVVMILIDPKFISDSKVLFKNYSMGLDLIVVQYKDGKNGISLDYSQVNEKLPHLIVKKNGKKYIKLEKSKCIEDKGLRKLYATLGSKLI